MNRRDLPKSAFSAKTGFTSSEEVLSDKEVTIATSKEEKLLMNRETGLDGGDALGNPRLKPIALANTLAIIGFAAFVICLAWAMIDTQSFIGFWESWAHGFDLNTIATEDVGTLNSKSIFGIVSFTASSWAFGYATAWIYNKLSEAA